MSKIVLIRLEDVVDKAEAEETLAVMMGRLHCVNDKPIEIPAYDGKARATCPERCAYYESFEVKARGVKQHIVTHTVRLQDEPWPAMIDGHILRACDLSHISDSDVAGHAQQHPVKRLDIRDNDIIVLEGSPDAVAVQSVIDAVGKSGQKGVAVLCLTEGDSIATVSASKLAELGYVPKGKAEAISRQSGELRNQVEALTVENGLLREEAGFSIATTGPEIPDGCYYAPDGGDFVAAPDGLYWWDGNVTEQLRKGDAMRYIPTKCEDFSKWSDAQREAAKLAAAKTDAEGGGE